MSSKDRRDVEGGTAASLLLLVAGILIVVYAASLLARGTWGFLGLGGWILGPLLILVGGGALLSDARERRRR